MLGWRRSYRLLGVSILLMMTACALALCKPWPVAGSVDSISRETKQYTPREMLRSPKFWIFYLYGFLAASVGSSVVSFSRDFAMVLNASENAAIALVGVVSVSNGAGRILTGILMDACGDRRTMTCVSLLTLLASLLLLCASVLNALFLAACGYVLTGLSFGACATISSAFVNRQFGSEHFAVNYSFSNSKLLLSSLSASLCAFLLEKTEDYAVPFVLLVFCAAIAAIFNHLLWSRRY